MIDDDFDMAGVWPTFCARLGEVGARLRNEPFPTAGERFLP
jgi:hypothetical protein